MSDDPTGRPVSPGADMTPARGGGSAARLSDVASAAGVSPPLASRIINGDLTVRATDRTKERVLRVADEMGYVPNISARNLRASRTGLIGLVVHDLTSPIYVDLLAGAREAAAEHGIFLLLGDADELMNNPITFRNLVVARRIDGLLVQGGHAGVDQRVGEIAAHVPTLVVNAPTRGRWNGVGGVYPDEVGAAALLTRHLLDAGARRIGVLLGPESSETSRLRLEGVVTAVSERGGSLRPESVVHTEWTADGGAAGLARLLDGTEQLDAVVAGNVLMAVGALSAAHAAHVDVPGSLRLGAIHDAWFADHVVPAVTTVSLPLRQVGATALRRLLNNAGSGDDVLIDEPAPVLHVRASS